MKQQTRHFTSELTIIGSGLAGCSASIFALNQGISTAQTGNTGAIAYTTGYLDLLGNLPGENPRKLDSPWDGIESLKTEYPKNPLCRVSKEEISEAFDQVVSFISKSGIIYSKPDGANKTAITPAGTSKPTYSVPGTMLAGVDAYQAKSKCIIIDFLGLRGFSSREVVANLQNDWPSLTAGRIAFPGMESGEIYPEVMARALEVPSIQEQLAEAVKEILGDAEVVGMPAIMGMHNPDEVMNRLSELIGKPLFEIPTMPPSVPGIRLREMFEQVFPQKGITLIPQQKVKKVEFNDDAVELYLTDNYGPIRISSQAVILASGRFLSGGLEAEIEGISEPLLGLHVSQPETRNDWYREQYMDSRGHDIHYSGIEVDEHFRPLTAQGNVVDPRLFAAGIVLAHQDWIRGRCGAGVAIATAFKAVQGARKVIEDRK